MSMMAPKFLQRDRHEPPPIMPTPPVSPEVAAFIDSTTRQREELAYLRSHSAQLENDLKVANERLRLIEAELAYVRNDRDYLCQHDAEMLNSLDNIETLIMAAKSRARATAYAPPGSGTQKPAETNEQDNQILDGLAIKLAPEPINADARTD